MTRHFGLRHWAGVLQRVSLAGALLCAAPVIAQPVPSSLPAPDAHAGEAAPRPGAMAKLIGRTEKLLVVLPAAEDTAAALAERFLGSADRAGWLGERGRFRPGEPLVVPLQHPNPVGMANGQLQAVPIISYHRFSASASTMAVTPEQFDSQLQLLRAEGFSVMPLVRLAGFLQGREALEARSVVIVVTDAHASFYEWAYPLIQRHRVPVTLFIHTDTVGDREMMSWEQIQAVSASGLVSVQTHSRTGQNLARRPASETERSHRRRLEVEVQTSRKQIEQRLPGTEVVHFAYPFGAASGPLADTLKRNSFELGLTAEPGSNTFLQPPLALRRILVLGEHSPSDFRALLTTHQEPAP